MFDATLVDNKVEEKSVDSKREIRLGVLNEMLGEANQRKTGGEAQVTEAQSDIDLVQNLINEMNPVVETPAEEAVETPAEEAAESPDQPTG